MKLRNISSAAKAFGWKLPICISEKVYKKVIKPRRGRPEFVEDRLYWLLRHLTAAAKKNQNPGVVFTVPPTPLRLEDAELLAAICRNNKEPYVVVALTSEVEQVSKLVS